MLDDEIEEVSPFHIFLLNQTFITDIRTQHMQEGKVDVDNLRVILMVLYL